MSQRELVLARLRRGPLCQTAIYREPGITHRLAARIYDLRQQGHDIDSRPCQDPSHRHDSPVVEYVLNDADTTFGSVVAWVQGQGRWV